MAPQQQLAQQPQRRRAAPPPPLLLTALLLALAAASSTLPRGVDALVAPTPEQRAALVESGQWDAAVARAKALGSYRTDPALVAGMATRLRAAATAAHQAGGVAGPEAVAAATRAALAADRAAQQQEQQPGGAKAATQLPTFYLNGLPSTGAPVALVIVVAFPDAPADAAHSPANVKKRMFSEGVANLYPYDSISAFYRRASYGALNITGRAYAFIANNSRAHYVSSDNSGMVELIEEALDGLDKRGVNMSQFDSDGDGFFDALFIKWFGPLGTWGSFWFPQTWQFFLGQGHAHGGVSAKRFVWAPVSDNVPGIVPWFDVHECGHLLGLPDLYDYNDQLGPGGGVGGLDMMDQNWGDHNAFSKFLLGWLTPTLVTSGSLSLTHAFRPSGADDDAVLVFPGFNESDPDSVFGQFFMVQYRKRDVGDDPGPVARAQNPTVIQPYPADGLLVWHVDARLKPLSGGGEDYRFDNSDTAHKLLALEQADGLFDIEKGTTADPSRADAGDFYDSASQAFTPDTNPSSDAYDGSTTGVYVTSIGAAGGATIRATFSVGQLATVHVDKAGDGQGTVTSSPGDLSCGATCTSANAVFLSATAVTLTAAPAAGSVFSGWSGPCSGGSLAAATCTVNAAPGATTTVTATFLLKMWLTVTKVGNGSGSGTVASSPAGIACGATCSAGFAPGRVVSLTATPDAATATFASWGGACSGAATTCSVTMSAAQAVTARFFIKTNRLTVTRVGGGTVASSPAGIACGATCSASFACTKTVTLTATPALNARLAAWSGDCTGAARNCTVAMSAARAVTATFGALSLAAALDDALPWTTGGSARWNTQQWGSSRDGADAAVSGRLNTSAQVSWLQATVSGAGTLSFWWRTDSGNGTDWLSLYLVPASGAAQLLARASGQMAAWQQRSYSVAAGAANATTRFKWQYKKAGTARVGADCGWLDKVAFSPAVMATQQVAQQVTQAEQAAAAAANGGVAVAAGDVASINPQEEQQQEEMISAVGGRRSRAAARRRSHRAVVQEVSVVDGPPSPPPPSPYDDW